MRPAGGVLEMGEGTLRQERPGQHWPRKKPEHRPRHHHKKGESKDNLQRFLADGKVVYVGFGSLGGKGLLRDAHATVRLFAQAITKAGWRPLVSMDSFKPSEPILPSVPGSVPGACSGFCKDTGSTQAVKYQRTQFKQTEGKKRIGVMPGKRVLAKDGPQPKEHPFWSELEEELGRAAKGTGRQLWLLRGSIDHGWLFPRCSAVLHHGGSGTVATALLSGTPQVSTC